VNFHGAHPDLLESLVSAAASVADQYLQTGKPLGFSLVGTVYGWPQGVSLPPARGARQWARVMTALAWVQPGGSQTSALYHRLEALAQRLKPGDHLVYTACFPRPEVAPYLQRFTRRGIRVTYMPVGPHGGRAGTEGVVFRQALFPIFITQNSPPFGWGICGGTGAGGITALS